MAMEIKPTNKEVSLLAENILQIVEQRQKQTPGVKYETGFVLRMSLEGEKSSGETIDFLKALNSALSKFDKSTPAMIQLDVNVVSDIQRTHMEEMDSRLNKALALQEPPPKKLITR